MCLHICITVEIIERSSPEICGKSQDSQFMILNKYDQSYNSLTDSTDHINNTLYSRDTRRQR